MQQRSDADLIQSCQNGEAAAWEQLVARYQRLIYTIPRRAGLDDDAASDVFQEVFTTLYEKLDEIKQPERLQAWLVTTTRRKTWRLICLRRATVHVGGGDADENDPNAFDIAQLADDKMLPDEVLTSIAQQHQIRLSLAELDERCRTLLTLLYYADEALPYTEIAARLGTTEGSIGPTRARCLKKLLREFEKKSLT